MKLKLTQDNVRTLGLGEHFDTDVPKLVVRVRAASRKYVLRYEDAGETVRLPLGDVGTVRLSDARDHAKKLLSGIWQGIDPREAHRREKTADLTVGTMVDQCLPQLKVSEVTRVEYMRLRAAELPPIQDVLASALTQRRIVALLTSIETTVRPALGPKGRARKPSGYTANRVFDLLRLVFNWACAPERELVAGSPMAGLRKSFEEDENDRYLSIEELKAFLRAIDDLHDKAMKRTTKRARCNRSTAAMVLMLSGLRRRAVIGADSSEFEGLGTERAQWNVPASRMKNKKPHVVPLSTQLDAIIQRRLVEVGGSGLLFPVTRESKHGRLSMWWTSRWVNELKAGMDAYLGFAAPRWKIHNLRSTMSTHMTEQLDIRESVVDKIMSHTTPGPRVRRRYNRAELLPARREALQKFADWIDGIRRSGIKEAGTAGGRQA